MVAKISKLHFYFTPLILHIIILILCKFSSAQLDETCPPFACPKIICELKQKSVQNFCENVKCAGINVTSCTEDHEDEAGRTMYEEHLTMCGCCPGCVKYLGN